jgi:integrase
VKRPKNQPRDRLVTKEELEGLVAIAPRRVGLAMQLAAMTGQRQSDILKFRWADIKGDSIHLRQNKTGKRLALKISADLEAVLDQCWLLEGGGKDGSEYILPTSFGRKYTSTGFRTLWQRTIGEWCRLGNPRYQFRDLRAMAATRCPTPEAARRLLGHTNIAMTLRVYRRGTETADALDMPA